MEFESTKLYKRLLHILHMLFEICLDLAIMIKKYVVVLPCIYIHFQLYHIVILKTYNCRQDDQNTVYMQVVFHLNLIFVYTMYFDLSTPN